LACVAEHAAAGDVNRPRLLAWNIGQGGGARLTRIADALARQDADILVLSEYRGGDAPARDVGYPRLSTRDEAHTTAEPQWRADRLARRLLRSWRNRR